MIRFALLVTLLMTMIDFAFAQGDAPPFTQGQDATTKNVSTVIKVPAKQSTKISGSQSLLETGNKNRLENPSFEHSTFSTGWTSSVTGGAVATVTVYTTNPKDGSKAVQLNCNTGGGVAGTCSFKQEFNHNTFMSGVQGLVSIWAATTGTADSTAKVYALVNGSRSSQSVSIASQASITGWGHYKVPWTMGNTSFGIEVVLDLAASRGMDVFLDDAFAGPEELKANVDQSRIAGESYFAPVANCVWSRTSTTVGAFTADADCPGPTVSYNSIGVWQTTDSNLPRQTVNNLPPGVYKATFFVANFTSAIAYTAMAINDGTTTCQPMESNSDNSNPAAQAISCVFNYSASGDRVFELYTANQSATVNINNNRTAPAAASVKFILEYFGSGSVYSSTNADTDWTSCGHTTSDFTGFGTVSAIETQCRRDGGNLQMKGKFTTGTTSATEARINLKFNGSSLTAKGAPVIPSIQIAEGFAIRGVNTSNGEYRALIEPSAGYIVFDASDAVGLSKINGSSFGNTTVVSFFAKVPINGWENSNVIIGSFNEVVTSPGVTRPKTCHYSFGGASATLASPTECASGTCTEVYDSCGTITPPTWGALGYYANVTIAAGTFANSSSIYCECLAYDTTNAKRDCDPVYESPDNTWSTTSTGGWVGNLNVLSSAGAGIDGYVQLKCEGQAP